MGEPTCNLPQAVPPSRLSLKENKVENWKLWKQTWENFLIVGRLQTQAEDYRRALLLSYIGNDALRVYNSMQFENDEARTVANIIKKFDDFIIGTVNETYERYRFNSRNQLEGESVDDFVTALRDLSRECGFCDCLGDSLLRDKIVFGIRDNAVRKKLLEIKKLDLKRTIDICRAAEVTELRMRDVTGGASAEPVHKVTRTQKHFKQKKSKFAKSDGDQSKRKCKFCCYEHEMVRDKCPAWGKPCKKCGQKNHFQSSSVCKGRKIQPVEEETDSEVEYIDTVRVSDIVPGINSVVDDCPREIYAKMIVGGQHVNFQIDSGAAVNLLPAEYVTGQLEKTNKVLVMWNKTKVRPLGTSRVKLENPKTGRKYNVNFVVVAEPLTPLLGASAVQRMNLVTVHTENFQQVASVELDGPVPAFVEDFRKDVFDPSSVGDLGTATLTTDSTVPCHVGRPSRVPFALRPRVKDTLDQLENMSVVAPEDQPTDWVSNMVVGEKTNGDIRVCIDPLHLNQALKREHFQLPTLDDVLPSLSKARCFTTADLKHGYWHVKLDDESSRLTTFATPFGHYRWLRLPFGLTVSSEIFQKKLLAAVEGLPGIACVHDDVIVYGSGENAGEARANHDENLLKFLTRCREKNIHLNWEKLKFCRTSIPFMGHVVSEKGLMPDPDKVKAVIEMPAPCDVQGVQRINGFVNYLAKFLPNLSDVMEPLRRLTRNDIDWSWGEEQETAFQKVKELVAATPVLRCYDPAKEITLQCDASQNGLGAALMQEGQPVAFASRALTNTERRYAQIEKEMLAIVFATEKFNQYTYGRDVNVQSDHKPLEAILKKSLDRAPKRLQAMMLRLQKYNINVTYEPGKTLVLADTLSRAFLNQTEDSTEDCVEHVHVTKYLPVTQRRLDLLREATESDNVLIALRSMVLNGWPNNKSEVPTILMPYFSYRDEITAHDGLLLRGDRVIVPLSMRAEMKEKLHSSHVGIEACLRRARECLYWPNMSAEVKDYISKCSVCANYGTSQPKEPLMSHDIPDRPWQTIGVDLLTLNGVDYVVTSDYFSNFWEIDRLHSTDASTVIRKLKSHFARYGTPETVVTDNGPQFSSGEFTKFADEWDFTYTPSSPGHSQSNGQAESAVKSAKRMLKKTNASKGDPYLALLDIRNVPSQESGLSPAQKMMSRRTRTLLPTTSNLLTPDLVPKTLLKKAAKYSKERQAHYYNKGAKELPILHEGDRVRMKPFVKGQTSWSSATVTRRLDERSYEVETETGSALRRNRIYLRKSDDNKQEPGDPPVITPAPENPAVAPPSPRKPPGLDTDMKTTRSGRVSKPPLYHKDYVKI